MSKSERSFWIGEKGREKFAETGPEMAVKGIIEELQARMGFLFKHGNQGFPLMIECKNDEGEAFNFYPDFIVSMVKGSTNGQLEKVVEVNGVYHFTDWQRKKGRWRDALILKQGYDIIHIDARLSMKSYHAPLKAQLCKALERGSPVEFIAY